MWLDKEIKTIQQQQQQQHVLPPSPARLHEAEAYLNKIQKLSHKHTHADKSGADKPFCSQQHQRCNDATNQIQKTSRPHCSFALLYHPSLCHLYAIVFLSKVLFLPTLSRPPSRLRFYLLGWGTRPGECFVCTHTHCVCVCVCFTLPEKNKASLLPPPLKKKKSRILSTHFWRRGGSGDGAGLGGRDYLFFPV